MANGSRGAAAARSRVNDVGRAAAELARQAARDRSDRVSHLTPARELEAFDIGDERVDVRFWSVVACDERLVGAVDRLMVEQRSGRIRYLSVSLAAHAVDDNLPNRGGSVLVPVGVARRLDHCRAIVLEGITSRQIVLAPRLHARPVTRADENATLTVYGLSPATGASPHDAYGRPHFDDRHLLLSVR